MARHLITSALPYINGVKHLGNLAGSMLPADAYARYLRQRGHDVLYICATDEHGTPAELAAKDAGLPVGQYCTEQHVKQAEVGRGFGLSFDHFGRSSSPHNHALTQHIGRKLAEHGFIENRLAQQLYSRADGRFLPDRYVIGTCPHCGYTSARGDQCENCTRLLDPLDLIEPRSAITGSPDVEVRSSRHLYFLQSKMTDQLRTWLAGKTDWPTLTTSIALKWLNEGVQDRSITRDLEWGVPVDREGFYGKVYYVWFDAPIEYLGATSEWADLDPVHRDWKSWWYDAADVTYTQFMAKDNIPFHTIMFPAMLLGTEEPWKLADHIKGVSWLNYYGGKFSTSRQHGIFMDSALEILPADYWRYFLLANAPESDDANFTWELFAAQVNKDLADTLGNLVNRVLTFSERQFGPIVPDGGVPGEPEHRLAGEVGRLLAEYEASMEAIQLRRAVQRLKSLWRLGNSYLELKAPWHEIKQDRAAAALTLRMCMSLLYIVGLISEPIIPATAATVQDCFTPITPGLRWPAQSILRSLDALPAGSPFRTPPVLFRKLTDSDVTTWRNRFGTDDS